MTVKVSSYFQNRWTLFWATSYTFEFSIFDEFWFPRLGEPPLNATLLIDATQLAETWADISEGEESRVRRANRDYLVRGVRLGGGAFHPKTYFFANNKEGVLLVGSGNLGIPGLEEGHEVFAVFESKHEDELRAMRQWRDWMERLIAEIDDRQVSSRWLDLRSRTAWLQGHEERSIFVSNWDRSLLSQFIESLTHPVDELHAMSPFFDQSAGALRGLIDEARPRQVHLYVGRDTSVDGSELMDVLETSGAELHLYGYEPDDRVHAKLLGAVSGKVGTLLSGSANITRAALLGAQADRWSNTEAGVLLHTDAGRVRSAFAPDRLVVVERTLESVADLTFRPSTHRKGDTLFLRSAIMLPAQCIEVAYTGDLGES